LVNRTVSMTNRYLGGQRPDPGSGGPLPSGWPSVVDAVGVSIDGCLLHEALAAIWSFVGEANRFVDAEKPWELNKAVKAGDEAAADRLRLVLGDLVEACRVIGLAAAPFLPGSASRVLAQLGYTYPYGADGNGGPPLGDELRWGAHAGEPGTLTEAQPLFPRLETEGAPD
jgi:methionyl-tRNA synthetase